MTATTLKTFNFATDGEMGTVQAESLEAAFSKLMPTDAQLEDGAWLWVEDLETGDRLDTRD